MATRPARRPARAGPALRPVLGVVRGAGRRRRAFVPLCIALVAGIFAVAALQGYLVQEGFRAARLERQVREAEEEYAILRARVAELSAPERVEQLAAERGMVAAGDPILLPAPASFPEPDSERVDYTAKRLGAGRP